MNRRRRRRNGMRGERVAMLAAAVFVLTALTMTGVYVKEKNSKQNDGYIVDLSQLEESAGAEGAQEQAKVEPETGSNDMDAQLELEAVGSAQVVNPDLEKKQADSLADGLINGTKKADASITGNAGELNSFNGIPADGTMTETQEGTDSDAEATGVTEESSGETDAEAKEKKEAETETAVTANAATLSFPDTEVLEWPIVGNVLLNYSMDKAIFFQTLGQYKYNPSIVIQAQQGENITAAADAVVKDVYTDAQTGGTICFDLGDGYELTYGQLENISVNPGEYVEKGQSVGTVADPTVYYSQEGCNVYFKLTKDGVPVNPLSRLE